MKYSLALVLLLAVSFTFVEESSALPKGEYLVASPNVELVNKVKSAQFWSAAIEAVEQDYGAKCAEPYSIGMFVNETGVYTSFNLSSLCTLKGDESKALIVYGTGRFNENQDVMYSKVQLSKLNLPSTSKN